MFTTSGAIVALCLWLTGLGLLELFELLSGAERRERGPLERHGVAILLGLSALTALYVVVAIAGGGPVAHGTGRMLAFVPAGLGLLLYARGAFTRIKGGQVARAFDATRRQWSHASRRRSSFALIAIGTAATLFFALFAVFFAGSLPVHLFDSLYHFAYKGKVLFAEGFGGSGWMVPSEALELGRIEGQHDSVGRLMTHPNYPPGIPALHSLVGSQLGRFSEDATRPLMSLYVLGCAALLWAWLSKRSLGAAVAGTLSWVSLPFLYYSKVWYPLIKMPPQVSEEAFFGSIGFQFDHLWRSLVASWMGRKSSFTDGSDGTMAASFPDGWTLDGSADLPQAVLFGVGLILAWRCLRWSGERADRADALCAGVILGGCTLVKNEGLALLAVAGGSMGLFWLLGAWRAHALASKDRTNLRGLTDGAIVFGIAALMAAPWMSIRGEIPSIDEDYPQAIKVMLGAAELSDEELEEMPAGQPTSIAEAFERVPVVLGGFVTSFIHVLRWNLVWILFIATVVTWLVLRGRRLLTHPMLPLLLAAVGTLVAYGLILVVTPWDLPLLFSTAIPGRIILHVVPLVIFVTAALMWRRRVEWDGPDGFDGASGDGSDRGSDRTAESDAGEAADAPRGTGLG